MTNRKLDRANDNNREISETTGNQTALSSERLEMLANQIAIGNSTFRCDLVPTDRQKLMIRVAEIRRCRLLKLFAMAIAKDIAHTGKKSQV